MVAFITGGGRGFGQSFGRALLERGARIVLADIDREAGERAAGELRALGGDVISVVCDVSDESQVNAAVGQAVEAYGGIDLLINNAALHSSAYAEPMERSGVEKLRRLFDVNVMGVIICTLAVHPVMKRRGGGIIVNISSAAAYTCPTAYGVSKLAVRGLTITTARELAPDGIRVNAIAPGLIQTDTIKAELPESMLKMVMDQQVMKKRKGEVSDVVDTLLFLCSERASFITGETLRVSGGFTLAI